MPTRAGFRLSMAWFWKYRKKCKEWKKWEVDPMKIFRRPSISPLSAPSNLLCFCKDCTKHCQASEWHGRCATRGHLGGSKIALIRHEWRACWSIFGVKKDTPNIPTMCKPDPSHWSPKVCGRRPSDPLQIKIGHVHSHRLKRCPTHPAVIGVLEFLLGCLMSTETQVRINGGWQAEIIPSKGAGCSTYAI